MARCLPILLTLVLGGCVSPPERAESPASQDQPVAAVFSEEDLPAEWKEYTERNRDFFR